MAGLLQDGVAICCESEIENLLYLVDGIEFFPGEQLDLFLEVGLVAGVEMLGYHLGLTAEVTVAGGLAVDGLA